MEVINNFIGTVYKRVDIDDEGKDMPSMRIDDEGQIVRWKIEYNIKRFPKSLVDKTSVPYLFSPNFKYQLDFNYQAKQFLILVTKT